MCHIHMQTVIETCTKMSYGLELFSTEVRTAQLKVIPDTLTLHYAVCHCKALPATNSMFYQGQGILIRLFAKDPLQRNAFIKMAYFSKFYYQILFQDSALVNNQKLLPPHKFTQLSCWYYLKQKHMHRWDGGIMFTLTSMKIC
jgi:hypothetical protein